MTVSPKERVLEQAYVLIARLTELRAGLDPHDVRGGVSRVALDNLRDALKSYTNDDLIHLTAELRDLSGDAAGHKPAVGEPGEILNINELVDELGGSLESPALAALLQAMSDRCEKITGNTYLSTLWSPNGGENMRTVLTIGGIRVPFMSALHSLDGLLKQIVADRAEQLLRDRFKTRIVKVQDMLDSVVEQLKLEFAEPETGNDEAMKALTEAAVEAEAEQQAAPLPPGWHKCIECGGSFNAASVEACPVCGFPRPVWFSKEETSE